MTSWHVGDTFHATRIDIYRRRVVRKGTDKKGEEGFVIDTEYTILCDAPFSHGYETPSMFANCEDCLRIQHDN